MPDFSSPQNPDYHAKVPNPIDLQIVLTRHRQGDYYRSKEAMGTDLLHMVRPIFVFGVFSQVSCSDSYQLQVRNAKQYFGEGRDVHHIASQLEKVVVDLFFADCRDAAASFTEAMPSSSRPSSTNLQNSSSHNSFGTSS